MDTLTLPAVYVRHIADQVRAVGGDVARWLAMSGRRAADLDAPLDLAGLQALARDAIAITGEPALGLFVGERLVATTHGMLGYAAASSPTLRDALALFARFTAVRTSLLSIVLAPEPRALRVRFEETRPLGDLRRPFLEAVVLSVKNVLTAIAPGLRIAAVAFPFAAPDYAPLARRLLAAKLTYGARWAGFAVPASALDAPLRLADPDSFREAAAVCQRELDKLTARETLTSRVRRLLLAPGGFPSLAITARLLHMTPRTLHRRLLDEGTSYRGVLDDVRHALALEHLRAGKRSLAEIADTLGYSDLANFRRAFKRWEAAPPSVVRKR
ncbi:MAG TPA: AraC family transcriptional regulator ligand-binding domain-containing protein [Kofleriaceae bacterium]|nr:AraC family transcriptional regulator ligand-binding domain-containing protein [Kofleriaceae bacterium]